MNLENEAGLWADRFGVVTRMGAVGGADLNQLRPSASHDRRHAEGATDFDQFAARDDRFAPPAQGVKHQ